MNVAYLIMAHAVDEQLGLLIDALSADPRSSIYIHMDRKVTDLAWLAERRGVDVLQDRELVNWGGFSIVRATQALLKAAVKNPENERFVFLSGACFPLQPTRAINDALLAAPPEMAVWGQINPKLARNEGLGRFVVTKIHPLDVGIINPKKGPIRDRMWNLFKRANNRLPYERRTNIADLWKGSQFFIFDRPLAEDSIHPPEDLVTTLKYALAPDEIFFTTLFVRALRKAGKALKLSDASNHRQGQHFIRKQVPAQRSFKQKLAGSVDLRKLTPNDTYDALESGALFARKCTPQISRAILAHRPKAANANPTDVS